MGIANRMNRLGMLYQLCVQEVNSTSITLVGTDKKIIVNAPIETISNAWYRWLVRDEYIQDAFHFLTPDEREFIMSGFTKEDWDATFGEEEK